MSEISDLKRRNLFKAGISGIALASGAWLRRISGHAEDQRLQQHRGASSLRDCH